MTTKLTLEQYKAVQEGAETWLASTRTDYTCNAIANHLISKDVIVQRTSQTAILMYPLFNKWLKATGKKPLYKLNKSFIEAYLVNSGEYGDANVLQELRTKFMEWLLIVPYSEI